MKSMMIGEIAKRSRVGIETIRYYEREGPILEPERRLSGYRQYVRSTVERLEYIGGAKELGFTLSEIRELRELSFAAHALRHAEPQHDAAARPCRPAACTGCSASA